MPRKTFLNSLLLAATVGLCLAAFAPDVLANAVLDGIAQTYKDATGGWSSQLTSIARGLFIKLACIEVAWAGIWWLWEKDDPTAVMISFLRCIMGLMFFWAILLNFDTWIPAIIDGFSKAGQTAGGLGDLTPSTVMDRGLEISSKLMLAVKEMSIWNGDGGTMLVAAASSLCIALAFAVIAGQMLVTLVESYFAISAGVLFLGFAGSRWTTTFAEKYISYAVSVGVKLFVTYLVIAAGQSVTDSWVAMMQKNMEITDCLIVLCGSGIYMFLGWQIPAMASSMLTGSVSMTLGSAMATGATMAAGMAGAAAATTAVGGKLATEGLGALRAASAAAGAGSAAGGGVMGAVAGAAGAMGNAIGGAVADGVKGIGKDSVGGRLAERISGQGASMAEAVAAGGGGGGGAPQPPAPPADAGGAAASGGSGQGTAPSGAAAAAPSGGGSGAANGAGMIDTSTSLSQALAERDGTGGSEASSGGESGAGSVAATADSSGAAAPAEVSAPAAPSAAAAQGGNSAGSPASAQPPAPSPNNGNKKSTREKVADGLAALGNQPNDAAAGAGIQIGMKLHD
ncbi:P-type conjugative transfer protein TrbL [Cupriavidus basilensis]